ncbi:MAG: thiamine pyrophosphate-dependent dehydrogenase E1 component subunit alpha [Bryobacteraceae bacterium]|jgi:pyruvate dehydrogenase E1 component alpha subunit
MLRIRLVEERIAEIYAEQQMRCPVHLCIGQEAVAVGVCSALTPRDYVFGGHRSHGHYLAKGGNLKAMIAELYGRAPGCASGKGGSMHLIDLACGFMGATPIVGSTIAIATGAALAAAMRGEDRVTVPFFGEGATEEGAFYESVNFAALKRLPIVFLCENNLYSVYSSLSVRQPAERNLLQLVKAMGMASAGGDGNDVMAVRELMREAVHRARRGEGPTLLEFSTYRWREHCGPNYDNDLGYRTEEEFLAWKDLCPIARMERQFLRDGTLSEQEIQVFRDEFLAEADEAIRFGKESPYPDQSVLMQDIYAEPSLTSEAACGN